MFSDSEIDPASTARPGAAARREGLDAPCGAGHLAISPRSAGLEVSGADIDPAGAGLLGEGFRLADLTQPLTWPDGHLNAVFCVEGIEHLENHYGLLRELQCLLKNDGILVITTPNIVSLRSRVRFFNSGFFHHDPRPLREAKRRPLSHIGLATFPELRYALHTSGFQLLEVRHTHTKPVSYLYGGLAPWMWLYTLIAFRKEKDPVQRTHNRAIRAALFSRSLLFGENLMLVARKRP